MIKSNPFMEEKTSTWFLPLPLNVPILEQVLWKLDKLGYTCKLTLEEWEKNLQRSGKEFCLLIKPRPAIDDGVGCVTWTDQGIKYREEIGDILVSVWDVFNRLPENMPH